jgi:hypothetical protein
VSDLSLDPQLVQQVLQEWRAMADSMTATSSTLSGQAPLGMSLNLQGPALTFLSTWAGHASESATLATGFADALEAVVADVAATDEGVEDRVAGLDTRLGPAR